MAYRPCPRPAGAGRGILPATVAAGPVFLAMVVLGVWQSTPDAVTLSAGALLLIPPVVALSMVFGSIIAALPVAIGAHAMAWAARRNAGLAHPAAWAVAGGLAAGGWMAFATVPPDGVTGFALTATGAICAAICRARIVVE